MITKYPKTPILHLPTPLDYLENISADLGINLYVKRDDLTSLAMGGNKLRKLEYFVADAKAKGATLLLTVGGAQTNHGRLTCAAARQNNMKGAIIAVDEYPGELSANLLLDGMMGCDVWIKRKDGIHSEDELFEKTIAEVSARYEAQGEKVYFIPMGGSNELGILGYYNCAEEIAAQTKFLKIDNPRVVSTVGSMGTYMGLFTGILNEKLPMRLTGIGVCLYPDGIAKAAKEYFERVKAFYGLTVSAEEEDFDVTSDYDRGAYNNPCREVREAMYYMAEKEALILDPCYTGKCFAGLLEMVRAGKISRGENVIFLHTGGSPGINTPFHRIEIEHERDKFMHIID